MKRFPSYQFIYSIAHSTVLLSPLKINNNFFKSRDECAIFRPVPQRSRSKLKDKIRKAC